MRLNYFKRVNNFGDALNPLIFNKLLPGFFDDDPSTDFFGIGSIIGKTMDKCSRKIIFSSGFAYGSLPTLDSSYEVLCVRGPLTAKALKLDEALAITDGAALLRGFRFDTPKKEYDISFMPHFESELKYPWKDVAAEAGVNYVSPLADPLFVIKQILKSKVVIAEAMHFAIVADTLRVPWIAVKAYPGINAFKWHDWAQSLRMSYDPVSLPSLFQEASLSQKLKQKTQNKLPSFLYKAMAQSYTGFQRHYLLARAVRTFEKIAKMRPQLSSESILAERADRLIERLEYVKKKYQRVHSP